MQLAGAVTLDLSPGGADRSPDPEWPLGPSDANGANLTGYRRDAHGPASPKVEDRPLKIRADARIDPSSCATKNLACGLLLAVVPGALDDPDGESRKCRLGEPGGDGLDGGPAVCSDPVAPFDPVDRASLFCAGE